MRHEATLVIASDPALIVIASPSSRFQRAWPPTLLILGLAVTVAWTALLAYGFFALVDLVL
jgi:hypothetical protein